MAVVIPQVVTEDRASGALVVDGSLKFDAAKSQYLTRSPGSAGNRNTWTNGSGNTYIYAAFAEAPTFNLYGAQSNAR